jgi:RNA 3'-terminal phosphate cyclase (ATP)
VLQTTQKSMENRKMLVIDGSQGEGGGQILRTTLSLAMVTGSPVRIERIRAGRAKPGLMRQHLVCVRAAQAVTNAEVSGDTIGSDCVTFRPGAIRAGEYRFAIGSAGSTTLVFQTVLPALLLAEGPSTIEFEGGTHNDLAPSVDFLRHAYLPLVRQMGIEVEAELTSYGFYPAGGGRWRALIHPWRDRNPLDLRQRGELLRHEAVVISSMLPAHVAHRELAQVRAMTGWPEEVCRSEVVMSPGPGNVVSLRSHYRTHTLVVETMGRQGISAERVATSAVNEWRRVDLAGVPVDQHLADQLLLPMALGAGGVFHTVRPSPHTLTNIEVIRVLTGRTFEVKELEQESWLIRLG